MFPYGRAGGLGAPLKAGATRGALIGASIAPLIIAVTIGPVGVVCVAVAVATAVAIGWWLMRLLPGLTGDCYGAVCEVVEGAVWLSAAPAARVVGAS
jgi:adenosylcobinamide-GDP ribazoletransferase